MMKNLFPWVLLWAGIFFGCQNEVHLPVTAIHVYPDEGQTCLYLQERIGKVTAWVPKDQAIKWVSDFGLGDYPNSIQSNQGEVLILCSHMLDLRSASDGRQLAQGPVVLPPENQALWVKDHLFYQSSKHDLISFDLIKRKFNWIRPAPDGPSGFWASWDTSVFFIPGTGHCVLQLDFDTGEWEDSIPLAAPTDFPALRVWPDLCIASGNQAAVFTGNELIGLELSPLKVKWRKTLHERPNATVLRDDYEVLVSFPQSDSLCRYDLLSGRQGRSIAGAASSESSGLLVEAGWIWVRREKSVVGFPPARSSEIQIKELPYPVSFGPFSVGNQIGVVLSNGTWMAWDKP